MMYMIVKSACRLYENKYGGMTIYLKREIAETIFKKMDEKRDYLAAFDNKTGIITVKEL